MNAQVPPREAPPVLPNFAAAGRVRGASVLVWDWPVRVFHALLALCVAGAWLSAESESWHLVHITLGYSVGVLVVFRLVWGVVGSPPARFKSFVRGPRAVQAYLRSLLGPEPQHHLGHNPAGALAIVGMIGLASLTVALGWASETERLPVWLDESHAWVANVFLALIGVHLVGVLVGSVLHRENLPLAMLTGRKIGEPSGARLRSRPAVAMVLVAAVLGFWAWQWQHVPEPLLSQAGSGQIALPAGENRRSHDTHEDD